VKLAMLSAGTCRVLCDEKQDALIELQPHSYPSAEWYGVVLRTAVIHRTTCARSLRQTYPVIYTAYTSRAHKRSEEITDSPEVIDRPQYSVLLNPSLEPQHDGGGPTSNHARCLFRPNLRSGETGPKSTSRHFTAIRSNSFFPPILP
jgi:hypothetical protein